MIDTICKTYNGLLVDIDDTLYSYENAHQKALSTTFEHWSKITQKLSKPEFEKIYREHRDRITKYHNGNGTSRSRHLAFQAIAEKFNVDKAYFHAHCLEKTYWDSLIDNMDPFDDIVHLVKRMHSLGKKTCIVTDMQASIQVRKLIKLKIIKYIDYVVTSEEIGVEKPDPKIYQCALNKLKMRPAEVIMLGDNFKKDIEGAQRLNIKAMQIKEGKILL